jgi:hypothetical protein
MPFAAWYRQCRAARIADGPDEVHTMVIAACLSSPRQSAGETSREQSVWPRSRAAVALRASPSPRRFSYRRTRFSTALPSFLCMNHADVFRYASTSLHPSIRPCSRWSERGRVRWRSPRSLGDRAETGTTESSGSTSPESSPRPATQGPVEEPLCETRISPTRCAKGDFGSTATTSAKSCRLRHRASGATSTGPRAAARETIGARR